MTPPRRWWWGRCGRASGREGRAEPRDDLVSTWAHATVEFPDGTVRPLTDDEIVHEALLVLDGGAETTRTVIGSIALELARERAERDTEAEAAQITARETIEKARIANEKAIAEARIASERAVRAREIARRILAGEIENGSLPGIEHAAHEPCEVSDVAPC